MKNEFKLAVVGKESSVLLFRALGCETYGVFNQEQAQESVEKLFRANLGDESKTAEYAVVFVEESYYKEFPEELIEKFTKKALPAIIPVPSANSDDPNFSSNRLRKIVERAVGSDILG
jgi:vacuolar-type H+-ATPase subunit F/Vma7